MNQTRDSNPRTPMPRGFPRQSPCISPSTPLTDKKIEDYARKGFYGQAKMKFYQAIERGRKLVKAQDKALERKHLETVNKLMKDLL